MKVRIISIKLVYINVEICIFEVLVNWLVSREVMVLVGFNKD